MAYATIYGMDIWNIFIIYCEIAEFCNSFCDINFIAYYLFYYHYYIQSKIYKNFHINSLTKIWEQFIILILAK